MGLTCESDNFYVVPSIYGIHDVVGKKFEIRLQSTLSYSNRDSATFQRGLSENLNGEELSVGPPDRLRAGKDLYPQISDIITFIRISTL